jgi:hypothetical protein
MEVVHFIYDNQPVDFLSAGKDNVMVNATQMGKVFGRKVEAFVRNETTKSFINECLKSENSRFLGIESEEDLLVSKQKSGTWMHRILALKFAAWLDPAFELWVYVTIDRMINHYFREQRDAMIEKLNIKSQREAKKKELLSKYPEMAEYFELEEKEKEANYKRLSASKRQLNQLKIEFSSQPIP